MADRTLSDKGKIVYSMQTINLFPMIFLGIIVLLLGFRHFTRAMYDEVELELNNTAHNVSTIFAIAYPGDYHLEGERAYRLYKGDTDITNEYELVDGIKRDTGLDITLFYQDTRILTTLTDPDGIRITGSGAPDTVIEDVLKTGESRFYSDVRANNTEYFAYYLPLFNSDGEVTGMVFAGKPREQVDKAIQDSLYPLAVADILITLLAAVSVSVYTRKFANVLIKIHRFLTDVSAGNLSARLDSTVLSRNDELGDIGRSALTMQRSLRSMIEQDALTGLCNRRFGDRKLRQLVEKSLSQQTDFCVAIGDIDFFKKVNDTYGHECGDIVLKNVADQLRSHMLHYGFVARWGGEEFLLVFEQSDAEQARHVLEQTLEDIRHMECLYEEQNINVTMTFGLTPGDTDNINELIRRADEKLYEGKTSGRNRVIS